MKGSDDLETPEKRTPREAKERLLAIRIPQSLLDAIDEHVVLMRDEVPWVNMTRSDVVRWMLTASLERARATRPQPPATCSDDRRSP